TRPGPGVARPGRRWEGAAPCREGPGEDPARFGEPECATASPPPIVGDRWRLFRTSRVPCFTQDHFEARRQTCWRYPRLREFSAEVLPDGAAARRARRLGHAGRTDLPSRAIPRLSQRPRI